MKKFQVLEDNKPADCHGYPELDKSWNNSIFNTIEEAERYAKNYFSPYPAPNRDKMIMQLYENSSKWEIREIEVPDTPDTPDTPEDLIINKLQLEFAKKWHEFASELTDDEDISSITFRELANIFFIAGAKHGIKVITQDKKII